MNPTFFTREGDFVCLSSGYKPSNQHQWGPGVRDIFALHYIISGKGYLETNQCTYPLKAGESFLIFPQTEVLYYPDPKDPWEYIWVDFRGEECSRLLHMTKLSQQHPVTAASEADLEPFFHMNAYTGMLPYERERANAKLRLLMSYYIEYYPADNPASRTDYVALAKEYIENNYWKASLTVSQVATYVKIERTYLFRLFKEAEGMSISGYLTAYRIKRACNLLEASDLSIKSIACSVGFEDQLYFSKLFKKVTACTPSDYRRNQMV